MTRIIVKVLLFDKYNLEHIKIHKVTKEEIEKVSKCILYHEKTYNNRYLAVGRVDSRLISIVIRRKATGIYYLVTARGAGKHERKKAYEKEKK